MCRAPERTLCGILLGRIRIDAEHVECYYPHTHAHGHACASVVYSGHISPTICCCFNNFTRSPPKGITDGRCVAGAGGAAGGFDGAPVGIECAVAGISTGVSEAMCELVLAFGVDGPLSQAVSAPPRIGGPICLRWCGVGVCVCARSRACASFLHTRTGV